jgi:hypothetical protein
MWFFRTGFGCLFPPLSALLVVFACLAAGASGRGLAADRPENFRPGDCRFCHGDQTVLPPGHVSTRDMDLFACRRCHSAPAMRLRGKMPLSHTHQLLGVSCTRCHGVTRPPKPAVSQDCLICHSDLEKLGARTSHLRGNPHQSPHYGRTLDCNLCHHEHAPSEDYCASCHHFNYTVP